MVTAYRWYVHVLASAEINISLIIMIQNFKSINSYNLKSALEIEKQEFIVIKFSFPSSHSNVVQLFT